VMYHSRDQVLMGGLKRAVRKKEKIREEVKKKINRKKEENKSCLPFLNFFRLSSICQKNEVFFHIMRSRIVYTNIFMTLGQPLTGIHIGPKITQYNTNRAAIHMDKFSKVLQFTRNFQSFCKERPGLNACAAHLEHGPLFALADLF
jgi:hypothetical protein